MLNIDQHTASGFNMPSPADKALTLNPDAPEFCPSGHSPTDSPDFGYTKEEPNQPFTGPAMSFITTLKPTPTLVPAQAPQIEPQPIFTSLPETPHFDKVNLQMYNNMIPQAAPFMMQPTPNIPDCGGYYDLTMYEAVSISGLYGPSSMGRSMPSSRIFQRPKEASRDEIRDVLRELRLPWTVANAIAALLPDVYTVPLLIYNRFDQLTRTFTVYLKGDETFPATHELWNSLAALPPATFPTFWNKPLQNGIPTVPIFHRPQTSSTQPLVGNMQVLRNTTEMQIFTSNGPKSNEHVNSGFKCVVQMTLLGDLNLNPLPADCHGHIPNSEILDHSDVLVIKLGKSPAPFPPMNLTSPQLFAAPPPNSPQVQYVSATHAASPIDLQFAVPAPTVPFQQIAI